MTARFSETTDWNKVAFQVFSIHSNGWLVNVTAEGNGKERAIRAAKEQAKKRGERCYAVNTRTGDVFFITD